MARKLSAAILVRREYYQKWRAKNRERVKAYNRAYWERKAQRVQQGTSNASHTEAETGQANDLD